MDSLHYKKYNGIVVIGQADYNLEPVIKVDRWLLSKSLNYTFYVIHGVMVFIVDFNDSLNMMLFRFEFGSKQNVDLRVMH